MFETETFGLCLVRNFKLGEHVPPPPALPLATPLMCSTALSNLKSDVDKLNGKKIKTIPVDLKKLSDVVNKDLVKK